MAHPPFCFIRLYFIKYNSGCQVFFLMKLPLRRKCFRFPVSSIEEGSSGTTSAPQYTKKQQKILWNRWFQRIFGPSDWFRTSGLVVPNHALYHLSYTRLFIFQFLSLWSKMWSKTHVRVICREGKAPESPVFSGLPGILKFPESPGVLHAPKARALPTALHPDTAIWL